MLVASLSPLSAQEGDGYGFLNIVNLIPGESPCKIEIGGKELTREGLKSGLYTGWFMAKNGPKSIKIASGELDPITDEIQLIEGVGNLIVIFLEPDKRRDAKGKPRHPKIRLRSFPTYKTKGYGLRFVSLCPGENRFQLGSLKLQPESFKPMDIPKWNGGGFKVLRNGQSIGNVTGVAESGAFYLFVGTDDKEVYASVIVSANSQEVPDYLKKEKQKPKQKIKAQSAPTSSRTPKS